MKKSKESIIYQSKTGAIELRSDATKETVWATLDQVATLFGRDKSVISRHFRNIFTERELVKNRVVAKNATTAADNKTYIVEYYNLDAILSVGYRVNSKTATKFRQWATKTLHEHIARGFTINRSTVNAHYAEFQKAIADIKVLLPPVSSIDNASVAELISAFADTWLSLDAYDKNKLATKGATRASVELTAEQLSHTLNAFKVSLMKKGEASKLFATPRGGEGITGIVGTIMQTFDGKALYPTIEEKAAHLLYFIVKNHPFVDGNKRSGAYAFVWFLERAQALDRSKITPATLTALTLFVAESNPIHKERMISLTLQLLKR